jgi:hypothetical protein
MFSMGRGADGRGDGQVKFSIVNGSDAVDVAGTVAADTLLVVVAAVSKGLAWLGLA